MPKKNNPDIHVVPVPRERPDLERLARAIVDLALKQLSVEGKVKPRTDSSSLSPPSDGEAA